MRKITIKTQATIPEIVPRNLILLSQAPQWGHFLALS
jgi:hypothetical protein